MDHPLAFRAFNAHINVEFWHSVKPMKYICAYINKGSDAANAEITKYQMGRDIAAMSHSGKFLAFPSMSDIQLSSTSVYIWKMVNEYTSLHNQPNCRQQPQRIPSSLPSSSFVNVMSLPDSS